MLKQFAANQSAKKILVIDNAETEHAAFNQPLFDFIARSIGYDTVNYTQIPDVATMRAMYSAVILSGVPLDYSFDSISQRLRYYQWVVSVNIPVLGICIGHEIIGMLFGGKIIRDTEAENGLIITHVVQDDPLFNLSAQVTPLFESFMMHRASVTVPQSFDLLARTTACGNAIMKHKYKAIYGMQAHPELSPNGTDLINNFVALGHAKAYNHQHASALV